MLLAVLVFYQTAINAGNRDPAFLKDYAVVQSLVLNVDPQKVIGVIDKESSFNSKALNKSDGKENCDSRGLVQIRSCDHKVTDEQAYNPVFAVNFFIKNIDKCTTWWKNTCTSK